MVVMASGRWLGVRLDLIASLMTTAVALSAVLVSQDAGRYCANYTNYINNYTKLLQSTPNYNKLQQTTPNYHKLQWNPVSNMVTNGPKQFGHNNEVAVLMRVSLQENVWSVLPGGQKSGRKNEVTLLPRWP